MDAVQIATLASVAVAVGVALYAARTDRTKNLVESVDTALGWKRERIEALEAEIAGLHKQVQELVICLEYHGIDPKDCAERATLGGSGPPI